MGGQELFPGKGILGKEDGVKGGKGKEGINFPFVEKERGRKVGALKKEGGRFWNWAWETSLL